MTIYEWFIVRTASSLGRKGWHWLTSKRPPKHPEVREFKNALPKDGYRQESVQNRYLVRRWHKAKEKEVPTYHFFIKKTFTIEKFRGFLIPTLDSGHRFKEGSHRVSEQRAHYELDESWADYLEQIGVRAKASADKGFRDWRRIVFFDKTLLLLFLENTGWIVANAADSTHNRLSSLAWAAIHYVQEIIAIHQIMMRYGDVIDCRYYDKGEVKTTDYYDFGYYNIEGIPFVYMPVYQKSSRKGILEERVYIGGRLSFHQVGIMDCLQSFEEVWHRDNPDDPLDKTRSMLDKQEQLVKEGWNGPPPEEYKSYPVLLLNVFDKTYVAELNDRLTNHKELKALIYEEQEKKLHAQNSSGRHAGGIVS